MPTDIPDLGTDLDTAMMLLGGAVGLVVLLALVIFVVSRFLVICKPNEIVVISGRKHKL